MKFALFFLSLVFAALVLSGCGTVADLAGINEKAVVIAKRSQIRSSGAVVAADLLQVERGQTLTILGSEDFEGEKWYNVRASDENETEGWIEARSLMSQKTLEKSRELFEAEKDVPTQATGQLRAPTNLRISPDKNGDENILQKLQGGDTFEIVGWKRVPKSPEEIAEKDDTTKAKANLQVKSKRQKNENEPERLDDKYEMWYKVRLQPTISPAPMGWIYGKQVELTVPSDIIFYRTGREFVAWSRIDGEGEGNAASYMTRDKDAGKESKPASWVILERSNLIEEPNGEEPDFDHVRIMGYDKINQDHYKVYLSGKIKGFLPLRVTGSGDARTFSVMIKGGDGEKRAYSFTTFKDARGFLKVNAPADIPKEDKNDR